MSSVHWPRNAQKKMRCSQTKADIWCLSNSVEICRKKIVKFRKGYCSAPTIYFIINLVEYLEIRHTKRLIRSEWRSSRCYGELDQVVPKTHHGHYFSWWIKNLKATSKNWVLQNLVRQNCCGEPDNWIRWAREALERQYWFMIHIKPRCQNSKFQHSIRLRWLRLCGKIWTISEISSMWNVTIFRYTCDFAQTQKKHIK